MSYYKQHELIGKFENSLTMEKEIEKSENLEKIDISKNNGGTTGYYDLPGMTLVDLTEVLKLVAQGDISPEVAAESIYNLYPRTLNDLIEYKNMKPWQHEVFKACYAIEERAKKNPDAGTSRIREINKILYYTTRAYNLEQKQQPQTIYHKQTKQVTSS